jgi:hypothetical protein
MRKLAILPVAALLLLAPASALAVPDAGART